MSDQFSAPKPIFIAPKDNGLLSPKDQSHHIPAPSLIERAQNDGNDKVAQLLAKAREQAKQQAEILERKSNPNKDKKEGSSSQVKEIIEINVEYIVSPEECIRRTRGGNGFNPNDLEIKKLFWANGGERFIHDDMTFTISFENWRRWKLSQTNTKYQDENKIPYHRSPPIPQGTKRFVSGLPTQSKFIAQLEAKNRQKNQHHYGFVQPAKRK